MSQGGNAAILENGKIKFKREGVYLFITTMGITISSDNNGITIWICFIIIIRMEELLSIMQDPIEDILVDIILPM